MNNDLTLTTRMNEPVEHASWIDPEAPAPPELNVPLTLREFPRWVRWRTEKSNDGRLIKKPYRIKGGAAKINDPTHWSTFEAARLAVPQLLTIDSLPKGLGFVLGAVNTEIGIGGVDLDTCLINGALEPRAAEIIKRLASYAEVSPSGTGVKVPFRYRLADLLAIRTAMERNGGEGTGRKWARPGEGAHPPAIELYLDSRYFAVTGNACVGSPRDLTTVALTDLLWLVNVAGPAFASTGKTPNGGRALIQDNSRSAIAYRKGCALRREGKTFEEMCTVLAEDPETAGWTTEKGMANNRRELGRIWDKAAPREQDGFERNSKNVIIDNNQHNIRLALTKLDVRLSYDAFAERILIEGPDQQPVRIFGDAELNHIYLRIDRAMKFRPRIEYFHMVMVDTARAASFHPVCQYLDGLNWDGVSRLDRWLIDHGGAEDTPYVHAVSSLTLIAAVRRVREPGCKFDEMLVLESDQGLNKSTALAVLAVREDWFSDDLPLDANIKEVIERLNGRWIVEAGELNGMRKGDVEHLKAFLSRRADRARLAYGRLPVEKKRACIIIGTTNHTRYLLDATGNRRFWPVKITRMDLDQLRRNRDQLWAEAAHRERLGESIRLDPALYATAGTEQDKRVEEDPWEPTFRYHFEALTGRVLTEDLWAIVELPVERRQQTHNNRIANVMKRLGWERIHQRFARGENPRYGYAKGSEAERTVCISVELIEVLDNEGQSTGKHEVIVTRGGLSSEPAQGELATQGRHWVDEDKMAMRCGDAVPDESAYGGTQTDDSTEQTTRGITV